MRRRALLLAGSVVMLLVTKESEAGTILASYAQASGHDGRVAAFDNAFGSIGVLRSNTALPLVTAALGGLRAPELTVAAGVGASQFGTPGRTNRAGGPSARSAESASSNANEASSNANEAAASGDEPIGLEVREDQLTSLLDDGQGNSTGLTEALSHPESVIVLPVDVPGSQEAPPLFPEQPPLGGVVVPLPPAQVTPAQVQVSEPSSMMLLGIALMGVLPRRRRTA